ncbi:MAG: EpsI family protein [Acidobacteria bacterium]|nr:EpsI family protein [Acidobacteriota bacterium]
MRNSSHEQHRQAWMLSLVSAAVVFMYSAVLWKLCVDWWTDDNYSHGLLVPFVIAFIVWQRFDLLKKAIDEKGAWIGGLFVSIAVLFLLTGTLASILYAQRLSLLFMTVGVIICLFGISLIRHLAMPLLLLFLALPIPQILFNKIALPLQMLASRMADAGMHLIGIPAVRMGNVIEIPFRATGEIVSLEVVEACSGIRSLVTLITLALILGYFTRDRRDSFSHGLKGLFFAKDIQRTFLLMTLAVPVALITNAARVIITGVIAYFYGHEAVEGLWHDLSGSAVFFAALLLLLGLNMMLGRCLRREKIADEECELPSEVEGSRRLVPITRAWAILLVVSVCGGFVNWLQYRGELHADRRPLKEIPAQLGSWEQRNPDIRFDEESESVLRASDYVMRDYYGPGKRLNIYVGYYASQRGGSTYHSPLNCLPGTGWEMTEPRSLQIATPKGRHFTANLYLVNRGEHQEYLIYWYQGRGRTFVSEYEDKLYTAIDSVVRRRSDGGLVRVMTPLGKDPQHSLAAAIDLTGHLADDLVEFLPD